MWCTGVVKLDSGDRLELLIPRTHANISLDGDSTFLGAIKLAWLWDRALDQTLNETGYYSLVECCIAIDIHWTSRIQELLYIVEHSWNFLHKAIVSRINVLCTCLFFATPQRHFIRRAQNWPYGNSFMSKFMIHQSS